MTTPTNPPTTGATTGQNAPAAPTTGTPYENEPPTCQKCGVLVNLRDNSEHDGYCDSCAHDQLAAAHAQIDLLKDQNSGDAMVITALQIDRDLLKAEVERLKEAFKVTYARHEKSITDWATVADKERVRAETAESDRDHLQARVEVLGRDSGIIAEAARRAAKLLECDSHLIDVEVAKLKEEVDRCKTPAVLHAHCVRYLSDAQVSHLFGERMTEIANDRIRLQARVEALEAQEQKVATMCWPIIADNDQLRAERDALREDKERLDWLERDGHAIETDGMVQKVIAATSGDTFFGDTLRAAIDAARSAGAKKEGSP